MKENGGKVKSEREKDGIIEERKDRQRRMKEYRRQRQ